jgi:hypothetical protein
LLSGEGNQLAICLERAFSAFEEIKAPLKPVDLLGRIQVLQECENGKDTVCEPKYPVRTDSATGATAPPDLRQSGELPLSLQRYS